MRNHLIAELVKMAENDERICLFTGDLGFGVLDNFSEKFPERFFNAGISEQGMTTIACGMAMEGNIVYTYSIGNFPGVRCIEQIRNNICYHNANVKIIVVGGGFAYGQLGMSHHATEDLAILRALPNMHVFCPADAKEAVEVLHEAHRTEGPCYIRLAKGKEPDLHPQGRIGSVLDAECIREGKQVAILSTGSILVEAIEAAEGLMKEKIEVGVYNFASVKPIDEKCIHILAQKYKILITLEEHNIIGGFGGAVAEVLSSMKGEHAVLIRMGLQDQYTGIVGSQKYLRSYYEIASKDVIKKVKEEIIQAK